MEAAGVGSLEVPVEAAGAGSLEKGQEQAGEEDAEEERSAPAHCSAFLSFANVPCHFHLLVVASMYYYM